MLASFPSFIGTGVIWDSLHCLQAHEEGTQSRAWLGSSWRYLVGPRESCSRAVCPRSSLSRGGGAASGEEEGKLVQTSPARLSGNCGWDTVACRQGLGCTPSHSIRSLRNDHSHGLQGSQSISPLKGPGLNSDGSPTLGDGVMASGRNETAPVG